MSQSGTYSSGGGGSSDIETLTGNSGGAVGPTGGNINVVGSGIISATGNPGTSTLTIAATNPVPIANGGTNATSMATTDGVVYYDGTRLVTTSAGTSTQVLTSNGPGLAPTFQASGGGSSVLQSTTVTFTSSQIKNLVATPQTLVAAQGANKVIIPFSYSYYMTYGGTDPFLDVGGLGLSLNSNGASWGSLATILSSDITSTSTVFSSNAGASYVLQGSFLGADPSVVSNQPVTLINGSGTDITGNVTNDNTVTVNLVYQVLTI